MAERLELRGVVGHACEVDLSGVGQRHAGAAIANGSPRRLAPQRQWAPAWLSSGVSGPPIRDPLAPVARVAAPGPGRLRARSRRLRVSQWSPNHSLPKPGRRLCSAASGVLDGQTSTALDRVICWRRVFDPLSRVDHPGARQRRAERASHCPQRGTRPQRRGRLARCIPETVPISVPE